jgi:hypothetical protein
MNEEKFILTESIELLERLNCNLEKLIDFGHEIIVNVNLTSKNSSRSFKRPLIEVDLINDRTNQG